MKDSESQNLIFSKLLLECNPQAHVFHSIPIPPEFSWTFLMAHFKVKLIEQVRSDKMDLREG
jgi:hypothetical protein